MKLADWLKTKKISRAEFARRIEMSEGTVSLLCSDDVWLSKKTAERIFAETNGEVEPTDFMKIESHSAPTTQAAE